VTVPRSPIGSPVELAALPIRLYAQALAATQEGMAALLHAQVCLLESVWSLALQPFKPPVATPQAAEPIIVPATVNEAPAPRPAVAARQTGRPQLRIVPDQPAA
jgi:hypothetical protein